jgi:hypothetical protein
VQPDVESREAWQTIDPGSSLSVYVACGAPAITNIQLANANGTMMAVVSEWSGIATSGCFDTKQISSPCPTAPASWMTGTTNVVAQNRELMLVTGTAGATDAGWTAQAPFHSIVDVFIAYEAVDQPPLPYVAVGTVARWNSNCFTDILAFKAQ